MGCPCHSSTAVRYAPASSLQAQRFFRFFGRPPNSSKSACFLRTSRKKRLIYRPWNEPITELLKISDRQTRFSLSGKARQPIEEESD
jgi:hypothetical protein